MSYDMEQVWVCKDGGCGMFNCLRCTTSQRGAEREANMRADLARVTAERDALVALQRAAAGIVGASPGTIAHSCSGVASCLACGKFGADFARLRTTNAALMELLEDGVLSCIGHTYASCDVGGSVNADRGCWQCRRARAAIEAAGEDGT